MEQITYQKLLDAGVHFGHLRKKWNPHMAPYIFMERNGIHIIDLNKTMHMLDEAAKIARQLAVQGRKILFVATKKQAKEIVEMNARRVNMPYVTERWLGGMLTNFATVRKSIKHMNNIEKMETDGTFERINKKERLMLTREKAKLEKVLGGIADLNRLPSALFIVDIHKEHIAVAEARKLNIPTIAMVDTNSDPNLVDFPIPANDDAVKSIQLIVETICDAIADGLEERKKRREEERTRKEAERQRKEEASKNTAVKEEA
ncbi:MAG: 30S ribosomal protein S2 [Bacteroidetes bacterium]|nr:MAG: 30S ribosomal protein S2 [Bacteroidota bacterium]